MERNLITRAAEFISEQRKKKRWTKAVTAMAAVVVFCTTYALILPAITQETDVFCGQTAHSHDEGCYSQSLICTLEEATAHSHGEDCYETDRTLVCTLEESAGHTHSDACRTETSSLTCTSEEEGHEHGDGCYTVTSSVTCGLEESSGHSHGDGCWEETRTLVCTESTEISEGGHVHGPECYGGEELTCGEEEHEHEKMCYSNPKADLESASVWERTLPDELTGVWADDLLAVAESQLGYRESTENYQVDDEGRKLGYTRYGDWYGDNYGHWCAMFVSFCLHYAEIPTQDFPWEANCQRWINELLQRDLYRQAGNYTPKPGDLIFFNWDNEPDSDHVGIVQEVTLDESGAVTQIKTIEGNTSNQVKVKTYLPTDESVMGYGELPENPDPPAESEEEEESEEPEQTEEPEMTEEPEGTDEPEVTDEPEGTDEPEVTDEPEGTDEPETPEEPEEEEPDNGFISLDSLMEAAGEVDLSNGPVVQIFAMSKDAASEGAVQSRSGRMFAAPRAAPVNLVEYLKKQNGTISVVLTDTHNNPIPRDAAGNYIVTAGTSYKMSIIVTSPAIAPGTYTYQLPEGLTIVGGEGDFILKDTNENVGSWIVDENTGLMTFNFNSRINNKTNVTISALMGVKFQYTNDLIPFDGSITVTVEEPEEETVVTDLAKWGTQGTVGDSKRPDPSKIYWEISIKDFDYSKHNGLLTITDGLTTTNQSYTDSDLAEGITFLAYNTLNDTWHGWNVPFSAVTWNKDKTSWSYAIPKTAQCGEGETLNFGDPYWEYYITYTTTPEPTDTIGQIEYMNRVTFDGQEEYGWAGIWYGTTTAGVTKTGDFQGSAAGGKFIWTLDVTIPGMRDNARADYRWTLYDRLRVIGDGDPINVNNDFHDPVAVTATRNGQTVPVPELKYATENDDFAWYHSWSNDAIDEANDKYSARELMVLSRCHCTDATCSNKDESGRCSKASTVTDSGDWISTDFCYCWTPKGDTVFNFTYETNDPDIIENYGGRDYQLLNTVNLGSGWNGSLMGYAESWVEIPGMFKKELTKEYDGATAHYNITVNEAKLDLTNGTPLTIEDIMTDTLAYVSGSLVITTTDRNGNTGQLTYGEDYTVTYDGSGTRKDATTGKAVHVLKIVIANPQPVQYTLDYDTILVLAGDYLEGVRYSNYATVNLWGETLSADSDEKIYTDINIAATTYRVSIKKTDLATNAPLSDAVFGLYNQEEGFIMSGTTDESGMLSFATDVTNGIILWDHTPYYIKEIEAPPGYLLSEARHWVYFCSNTSNSCKKCSEMDKSAYPSIAKIKENSAPISITNQIGTYELPETGGAGTNGYTFGGLLLMAGAGFLLYRKTRDGREAKTSS